MQIGSNRAAICHNDQLVGGPALSVLIDHRSTDQPCGGSIADGPPIDVIAGQTDRATNLRNRRRRGSTTGHNRHRKQNRQSARDHGDRTPASMDRLGATEARTGRRHCHLGSVFEQSDVSARFGDGQWGVCDPADRWQPRRNRIACCRRSLVRSPPGRLQAENDASKRRMLCFAAGRAA